MLLLVFVLMKTETIAQGCSPVPVVEAVRNGDFEDGYLPNGGATDFYSDMNFIGDQKSGGGPNGCNCCKYGMGDGYAVARADTFTCANTTFQGNTHWGINYGGDKGFKDHTAGKNGDGYALLVDLHTKTVSPKTGGLPIAWEQTVDVYPSESYFFSAWVANFSTGTEPEMQVTIIPENGGVVDVANTVVLPVNGETKGLMNWSQMSASWIPNQIYDKVTVRFEFVNVAGGFSGLDVAIDDISFINSCQNITGNNAYVADFGFPDTLNICSTTGEVVLDPQAPLNQRANASISWYKGTGNPQTEFATGTWSETVDELGTYRVCIDDPDNGCPVSDQVVIIEEMKVEIPDGAICDPSEFTMEAKLLPVNAAVTYDWSTPVGVADPGDVAVVVTTEIGAYALDVTGITYNGGTCSASANANVILNNTTTLDIPDVELCNPAIFDFNIDDFISSNGDFDKTFNWTVSNGLTDPGDVGIYSISESGTYSLEVVNTNVPVCIVQDDFTVVSNIPVLDSSEYCEGGGVDVTLTASDGKSYNWAADAGMQNEIGTGNTVTYSIPNGLTGVQKVWLQDAATTPLGTTVNQGTSWETTAGAQTITVYQTVKLTTVQVTLPNWQNGQNASLTFNGETIGFTANGATTVPINKVLGPGTYQISMAGSVNHIPNPDGSIAGYVDVTGGNTGAFNNFTFEASSACEPVAMVLMPKTCCTPPTDIPIIDINASTLEVCEPNDGEVVSMSNLTDGLDYQWQESTDGLIWTDIAGETGDVSGGGVTLTNVAVEQWYRYVIATDGKLGTECVKVSDSVQFIRNPLPIIDSISLGPNNGFFCVNEEHDLEVFMNPTTVNTVTYQWKQSGVGTGITTEGLTTSGTHTYEVVAEVKGCKDSLEFSVDVTPQDEVNIINLPILCPEDDPFQLMLDSSLTTSGHWTGQMGWNTYVSKEGLFDPTGRPVGVVQVKFQSDGVCPILDSADVEIVSTIDFSFQHTKINYCSNDGLDTLDVNQEGGVFWSKSGNGVVDVNAGVIDPSLFSDGVDTLYYGKAGGCGDTAQIALTFNPIDVAEVETVQAMCQTDAAVQLLVSAASTVGGVWMDIQGGNSVVSVDGLFDPNSAIPGYTEVIYVTQGFCPSADTIVVQVAPEIIVDVDASLGKVEFCNSDMDYDLSVFLLPNTSLHTEAWSISPAGNGLVGKSTFSPQSLTPGVYSLKYALGIPGNNCSDSDSVALTILPVEDPIIGNTITDPLCISQGPYTFTGTPIGGSWSVNSGGTIDPLIGELDLVATGIGTFEVTYAFEGNCPVSNSTEIIIVGPGDPTFPDSGPYCENLGVQNIPDAIASGGLYSGVGVVDETAGLFDPSIAGVGTHAIVYSLDGVCPIDYTTSITVEELPLLDIEVDKDSGCEPLTVNFSDATTGGNAAIITVWEVSDGGSSTELTGFEHTFNSSGCYDVVMNNTYANGCQDKIIKESMVCVNAVPTADFDWGPKNATVLDPFIGFDDQSTDASAWEWTFDRMANPSGSGMQNPYVTYPNQDSGSYEVTLVAFNGDCSDTITKVIRIMDNLSVYVPNAFTPDGDGLNDVFFPKGKNHNTPEGLESYEFLIFNRWGEMIWDSNIPYQPWDGTDEKSGKKVQQDTYVWKLVVYDNVNATLNSYYGHVSLIR